MSLLRGGNAAAECYASMLQQGSAAADLPGMTPPRWFVYTALTVAWCQRRKLGDALAGAQRPPGLCSLCLRRNVLCGYPLYNGALPLMLSVTLW